MAVGKIYGKSRESLREIQGKRAEIPWEIHGTPGGRSRTNPQKIQGKPKEIQTFGIEYLLKPQKNQWLASEAL